MDTLEKTLTAEEAAIKEAAEKMFSEWKAAAEKEAAEKARIAAEKAAREFRMRNYTRIGSVIDAILAGMVVRKEILLEADRLYVESGNGRTSNPSETLWAYRQVYATLTVSGLAKIEKDGLSLIPGATLLALPEEKTGTESK